MRASCRYCGTGIGPQDLEDRCITDEPALGDLRERQAAAERAVRHGVALAHDNPYVDLALDGEAPALLRSPLWRQCGIEFFSFSKAWCLGGYRLAFAIGAEPLITALRQLKGVVDFNQSLALQAGAIAALQQTPDWAQTLLPVYRQRRDRMAAALEQAGWPVRLPSMALYLWLQVPQLAAERGLDSESFCAALLEATGVCLTPGNGFGDAGEGHVRLALVHPIEQLEQAEGRGERLAPRRHLEEVALGVHLEHRGLVHERAVEHGVGADRVVVASNGDVIEIAADGTVGTVDQVVEHLAPYLKIGYRHLIAGFSTPHDEESLIRFAEEVLPKLKQL